MRLISLSSLACLLPADADRAAGCASIAELQLPGGAGPVVLEGLVPRDGRACWTLRLEAGRRLNVRLTSTGGAAGAALEVRPLNTSAPHRVGGGAFVTSSSAVSSSVSTGGSVGAGETRLSIGPQLPGGEFLIAVGARHGHAAVPYRLEVTLD